MSEGNQTAKRTNLDNGADLATRKYIELELRQKEVQLSLALESARAGFWDWNFQTGEVTRSLNLERMYGWADDDPRRDCDRFRETVHPEDRERVFQAEMQSTETGENCDVEFRIVRPDGEVRWMESKAQVFYDELGQPLRLIGINLDITERKAAEAKIKASLQEKEVLLQEVHHRVKNNLQVISSLLNLQSQHAREPAMQQLLEDCQSRIYSMVLVHELLYRSSNLAQVEAADYIRALVGRLVQTYVVEPRQVTVELELDEVTLDAPRVIPCGLIITELVSNALKHAFPGQTKGVIRVVLRHQANETLMLSVKNTGEKLPPNFDLEKVQSLGLQLVKVLVRQLGGTLEVKPQAETEFCLRFNRS